MQTRKSHAKSRQGCQRCKQRHIKCDESGPPCTNCAARKLVCSYAAPSWDKAQGLPAKTTYSSPKPCLDLSKPPRKLLELELMHRWSTCTYKSFSTNVEELHVLQVELPCNALKYDFMLSGLYAITALEMAVTTATGKSPTPVGLATPSIYLTAALEYYGRASAGFRAELSQISRANHYMVWIFSFLAAVFHLALPDHSSSTEGDGYPILSRMVTFFEMYSGVTWVTRASLDWLLEGSAPTRQAISLESASLDLIHADTRKALQRLSNVNDEISDSFHGLYRRAIHYLEACFAEEVKDSITGFCMAWPAVQGRDFAAVMRQSEQLALLLLAHWAVMLHRLPPQAWWANSMGRNIVVELSAMLWRSEHASMPEWRAGVSWVRQQINLPCLIE